MNNLRTLLSMTVTIIIPFGVQAQMMDLGSGYGSSPSFGSPNFGSGDFGRFPTIDIPDWNNPDVPDYIIEEEAGSPDIPETINLITNGIQGEDLDVPPPNVPTTGDLVVTEETVDVGNPTGLSLPDPKDFEPEDIEFPYPRIVVGVPDEVIQSHEISPLTNLSVLPSAIESCDNIPAYSGVDYALDLRESELAPEDYIEMHTLWVKSRVCRSGGTLTPESTRVRILNENDPRCVFYKGDDYKTDLALAETEEERALIRNLYEQYFFICF